MATSIKLQTFVSLKDKNPSLLGPKSKVRAVQETNIFAHHTSTL